MPCLGKVSLVQALLPAGKHGRQCETFWGAPGLQHAWDGVPDSPSHPLPASLLLVLVDVVQLGLFNLPLVAFNFCATHTKPWEQMNCAGRETVITAAVWQRHCDRQDPKQQTNELPPKHRHTLLLSLSLWQSLRAGRVAG